MFRWLKKKKKLEAEDDVLIAFNGHTGISLQRKNYPDLKKPTLEDMLEEAKPYGDIMLSALIKTLKYSPAKDRDVILATAIIKMDSIIKELKNDS